MDELDELDLADLNQALSPYKPDPVCCRNCTHRDWEYDEWQGRSYSYCELNIWMPFKKQSCKKQQPFRAEHAQK